MVMNNKTYKKAVVFALCLALIMPFGSVAVSSTDDSTEKAPKTVTTSKDTKDDGADETEKEEDDKDSDKDEQKPITDEEALKDCEQVSENDNLALYLDKKNKRLCLYVKESKKCWWTSPINAATDQTVVNKSNGSAMKRIKRLEVGSSAAIKIGELKQESRSESGAPIYSSSAKVKWSKEKNGVVATYNYSRQGVSFKVHYELDEDNLHVYCDSKDIDEENTSSIDGKILTKLQLCPYFAATPATEVDGTPTEGYMIVPDGSGAVIKYNNGKDEYKAIYSQKVYGRDYTTVLDEQPLKTEQAYMPVMATVNGKSGIVAVASEGDANVAANARVSGQDSQAYNNFFFEFEARSKDTFYMSGDNSHEMTVFEKGDIKTERFGVRFYAVEGKDGEDVNYADCAETYRNYLEKYKGFKSTAESNSSRLYMDMFGGVLKQTSIIGVPFNLKRQVTGFSQTKEIISKLSEQGVNNITVNYNDWTNASIKGKISTEVEPSGTLGGDSDFKDLLGTNGAVVYPSLNNFTMESGSAGYFTLTSTAIRVSNAYSRQSKYNLAYGIAEKGVAPALLTPNKYSKVFNEMIESYNKEGVKNIGFGDYSTKLVSDFSKNEPSSREKTMETIVNGYKDAKDKVGSVIADGANAYVLPYVSDISNVPLYSTGFNLTDYDIPFYQMVIHGSVAYASTPLNASSDCNDAFLTAIASGSQIHYDMTYEPTSVLQDTDYNDLYYTHYEGWLDIASNQYKAANEVLAKVSDYKISKYELSDDNNTITVTYSKDGASDVVVTVDKANGTVTSDGNNIDVSACLEGGE